VRRNKQTKDVDFIFYGSNSFSAEKQTNAFPTADPSFRILIIAFFKMIIRRNDRYTIHALPFAAV
jgi:hypothetical protein